MYLFQINLGAHVDGLERLLPNARIKLVRMQRELVACVKRYHEKTFWRSQLRAELALGGGLERLTEPERASIEEGRSFEAIFDGASNVQQLPWRLPGARARSRMWTATQTRGAGARSRCRQRLRRCLKVFGR
jgi:hypothetical protein